MAERDLVARALNKNSWPMKDIDELKLIFSPLLQESSVLIHAFTTRVGGNSPAPLDSFNLGRHWPDDQSKKDAIVNRTRLCQALGLNVNRLVVPGQVHSPNIAWVSDPDSLPDYDGVATVSVDTPILLHYADCVPVIIFDRKTLAFSVIHAGWRGTAFSIVRQGVKLLSEVLHSNPGNMIAAVGPAIGSCCYPTGEDVISKLSSTVNNANLYIDRKDGQLRPDLKAINAAQLLECGVKDVDVCSFCTACQPELFYSHRQSGGKTGRQGAIASLKPLIK